MTSKSFLLWFLLESFQNCSPWKHLSEGINQTRVIGSVPKKNPIYTYYFQPIQLYNRQTKGSKVPLPVSHGCVCTRPFWAVFAKNHLSFLDDPEVKVKNSICSGREKGLCSKPNSHSQQQHSIWALSGSSLCGRDQDLPSKCPLSSSSLVTEFQFLASILLLDHKTQFPSLSCS